MKIDMSLLKEKQELISVVLLGTSALLIALLVLKVFQFFEVSQRAQLVVQTAIEEGVVEPTDIQQYLNSDKQIADSLAANNLFVQPDVPVNPVTEVRAIFDNAALIDDRWYEVGDTIGNMGNAATVVAIDTESVTIEWNGRSDTYRPIEASLNPSNQAGGMNGRSTIVQGAGGRATITGTVTGANRFSSTNLQNMSQAERDRLRTQITGQFGGMGGMAGGRGGAAGGRGGAMGGRGGGMGGRGGRGG